MTAPGEDTAVAFGTSDYDFSQIRRDQELWFVPVVRLFQGDPDYLLVSIDDLLKGAKGEEHGGQLRLPRVRKNCCGPPKNRAGGGQELANAGDPGRVPDPG